MSQCMPWSDIPGNVMHFEWLFSVWKRRNIVSSEVDVCNGRGSRTKERSEAWHVPHFELCPKLEEDIHLSIRESGMPTASREE